MIDWIRVSQVTNTRCSGDRTDECRGHLYIRSLEPCKERVAASLVEFCVKLPHYGLHRKAVILYHVCPPLGIQHYRTLGAHSSNSPLHDDYAPIVVAKVSTPELIPPKMGVVVYQLGILLISGGTGLSDQLTRD
jgi:hypothetical protein